MKMLDTKDRMRQDWITRTPKWVLLCGFWAAQGAILYFLQALLFLTQGMVDGDSELWTSFLGEWPSLEDYTDLLVYTEFAMVMAGTITVLTIAQMIFMLPVRKPGLTAGHGRSIRKSLAIAGGVIGVLFFAFLFGIASFLDEALGIDIESRFFPNLPGDPYTSAAIVIGFGWLVATPILIRFSKPGRKEDVLARLSKKLFIGTIIEVALLIPLDVMVRRKTSCYCWAGTYWALTICGFVGVFALGPAVFLPILSKRRKTWYSGHCGVCGYDMVGMLDAPRCPECGTGWKDNPQKPAIADR